MTTTAAAVAAEPSYYTVVLEGNIAVGKTTLLTRLIDEVGCCIVEEEPIDRWINCAGLNLLHRMYLGSDDAFVFQVYATYTLVYRSVMRSRRTKPEATIRILERSPSSSVRCFGQVLYRNGKITDSQLAVLQSMLADWENRCREEIDLVLYLRSDPETAHVRMLMRDRPEERGVTVDYLRQLHDQHEQLYTTNPYRAAKWVSLDASLSEDAIYTRALEAIREGLNAANDSRSPERKEIERCE